MRYDVTFYILLCYSLTFGLEFKQNYITFFEARTLLCVLTQGETLQQIPTDSIAKVFSKSTLVKDKTTKQPTTHEKHLNPLTCQFRTYLSTNKLSVTCRKT